jgi:mono/diheme cytochrome c family protein
MTEMHYQPSYRSQEPPRRLPAPGAVPITGREVSYSFDETTQLANPVPATAQALARAGRLYQIECAFCHGPQGRGDGPVATFFQGQVPVPPVDFSSPLVRRLSEGELFWSITYGIGNMPPFGRLLSQEQRWLLVHFVRSAAQE